MSAEDAARKAAGKCGARTRRGTACLCQGEGRGGRCKFHGGASTGPRTEAGRARISALQKARWKKRREDREIVQLLHEASDANSHTAPECAGAEGARTAPATDQENAKEPRDGVCMGVMPRRRNHAHLPRLSLNPGRDRYGRGHR